MYRIKNLKNLEVFDKEGKKLGEVQDLAIDYFEKKVLGFIVTKKLFSSKNFIALEDIVILGNNIIAEKISFYSGLTFEEIKEFDLLDKEGMLLGNLEELLISKDFKIKALIVSKGIFLKFIQGKEIILIDKTILGKRNILYYGEETINLKSLPHSIWRNNNV